MEGKILQIMPPDNWYASYFIDDDTKPTIVRKLVCWALVQYEEEAIVEGMIFSIDSDCVCIASEESPLKGYYFNKYYYDES